MDKIRRVMDVLTSSFTDEDTTICIRNKFVLLAAGKKADLQVVFYQYCPIKDFTWEDNNYIYVDLEEN